MEEVGKAQRIAVGVVIRQARADAPEETVGTAIARMCVVVGQQATRGVDGAVELARDVLRPAHHVRWAEADGLSIAPDIILCRVARRAFERQAVVQRERAKLFVLAIDVHIVEIDVALLEEAAVKILELHLDILALLLGSFSLCLSCHSCLRHFARLHMRACSLSLHRICTLFLLCRWCCCRLSLLCRLCSRYNLPRLCCRRHSSQSSTLPGNQSESSHRQHETRRTSLLHRTIVSMTALLVTFSRHDDAPSFLSSFCLLSSGAACSASNQSFLILSQMP